MKSRIKLIAALTAALIMFSACDGSTAETKAVFAEKTEHGTEESVSSVSESTDDTTTSGITDTGTDKTAPATEESSLSAAEGSEDATNSVETDDTADTTTVPADEETTSPGSASETFTFAASAANDQTTSPSPNPGYEDSALKTVTSVQAAVQNVVYNYDDMIPSARYKDFYSKCVFVGDSICLGLKAYEVLPGKQVCAQGNIAARNILEYTFKANGYTGDLISCLKKLEPEYVVFSMGMNDVNMTSAEKFCENYGYLLSLTQKALPKAQLIVCSVTPVIYGSKFCTNTRIDSFNATLKKYLDATEKWIYADIAHGLKDQYNGLKSRYNGGDGIHLSGIAYKAILYQIAERVLDNIEYDADGNVVHIEAPAAEETTVTTTASGTSKTKKTKKTTSETTKKTKKTTAAEAPAEAYTDAADHDADTTKEP